MSYICNVRISTSYHNKAICRRSMYLRPRFGEGFLFMARHTPTTYSLEGCYSHQYIDLCKCRVSAKIDNKVTLWHFVLNQQRRFNRRNHKESESNDKQGVARRAKNRREITSSFESYLSLFCYVLSHTPYISCLKILINVFRIALVLLHWINSFHLVEPLVIHMV